MHARHQVLTHSSVTVALQTITAAAEVLFDSAGFSAVLTHSACLQVVRCELENAASVARTFLTSDVVVTDIPDLEPISATPGGMDSMVSAVTCMPVVQHAFCSTWTLHPLRAASIMQQVGHKSQT